MTDTLPVTYIHNAMRGAPVLNGQAGSLIALLDAFLITGFGLTTATSVSVSGGIATATLPSGQSFEPYTIVLVEGATPAALNGRARVITASSTSITWATTAPDGPATGTISIKYAPAAGWEKPFSKTNVAAYRSSDPAGSRFYYRIDDTGTSAARLRGYEQMTDVDTGTGLFPTDGQISGGGYVGKSNSANATPAVYTLLADSRIVYLCIAPYSTASAAYITSPARGFGDLIAVASGSDGYAAAVAVSRAASDAIISAYGDFSSPNSAQSALYCARPLSGLGGSQQTRSAPLVGIENALPGSDSFLGPFPSPVDGQLKYSRRFVRMGDDSASGPRAWVPGLLHIPQTGVAASGIGNRDTVAGSGELQGRRLYAIPHGGAQLSSVPIGAYLVDLTGPWR